MKNRPQGFLSEENISHNSEVFDYVEELHEYLWRFVRVARPGASGNLGELLDGIIDSLEAAQPSDQADLLSCGHSADNLGNFGGCNPMGSCVICDRL